MNQWYRIIHEGTWLIEVVQAVAVHLLLLQVLIIADTINQLAQLQQSMIWNSTSTYRTNLLQISCTTEEEAKLMIGLN